MEEPTERYPADWDERRQQVYERDNYTCQSCGATGGSDGLHELHADHITPLSQGGSHDLANLQTLCRGCHDRKTTADTGQRLDADQPVPASARSPVSGTGAAGRSDARADTGGVSRMWYVFVAVTILFIALFAARVVDVTSDFLEFLVVLAATAVGYCARRQ